MEQTVFRSNGVTRMTTSRTYDNANRLTKIETLDAQSSTINSFSYAYNSANQRTGITNADGSFWLYQYDTLGQVISGKHYWSDGTPVGGQQFEYAFDDIGNRRLSAIGDRQSAYTANALNQYTQRTVPGYATVLGTAATSATVTVNRQLASRRGEYFWRELALSNNGAVVWQGVTNVAVLKPGTNTPVVAQDTGHLLVPGTPEAFLHDADGNLVADGLWTNRWDAENRLVEAESLASVPAAARAKVRWTYRADGRWAERIVSAWDAGTLNYQPSTTNRFVWDGNVLLAVLDHTNGLVQSYLRGLDLSGTPQGAGGVGGLLALHSTLNAQPSTHFYCFDGNGNVVALVRADDGTVSATYEHGPFAEPLRVTGPLAAENLLRFSCQFHDETTGDAKYLHRAYTPTTGRWKSRDPIEEQGGINLYCAIANTSLNNIDALGLWKRLSPEGHLWRAECDNGDTLSSLAQKSEYGGQSRNWDCLWPAADTRNHGYPDRLMPGDVYDASNLAVPAPGATSLTLSVSSDRTYFTTTVVDGNGVLAQIRATSGEGASPISSFTLEGHGGGGQMGGHIGPDPVNPGLFTFFQPASPFTASLYASLDTVNTPARFSNAASKKGPIRCWFTRNAEVRFAGCNTSSLASGFAGAALRRGAYAYGTVNYSGISPTGITWGPIGAFDPTTGTYPWLAGAVTSSNWRDTSAWSRFNGGL